MADLTHAAPVRACPPGPRAMTPAPGNRNQAVPAGRTP
jgi:hypothetical protein